MNVTLDRSQRQAIRAELELRSAGWGDFETGFLHGERERVRSEHKRLGAMIAVMDAIGWAEQADAPDQQPVEISRPLAAWARREAEEILRSFGEVGAGDDDLDALEAFRAFGCYARSG